MKRFTSAILVIFMLAGVFCFNTFASETENDFFVYVSASMYGEFLTDINGEKTVCTKLELGDGEVYTLDDVFVAFHDSLYEGGSEGGYETAIGDYGQYITKFWGDTSGNFTYQLNFGTEDVYGPANEVNSGDYVEFFINKSFYPDTESYAKFEHSTYTATVGEPLDVMLFFSEYTADGLAFFPCSDASITIDGNATELVTNEEGIATITFDAPGAYIISASKSKILEDSENEETSVVPAISAPFCVVEVGESHGEITPPSSGDDSENEEITPPEDGDTLEEKIALCEEIAMNIAEKYIADSLLEDGNMHWFLADFADFSKAYPESGVQLGDELKQKIVDKIIEGATLSESQSDLAKSIIALRSMGYDAKNAITKDGAQLDIVKKLTSLISEESVSAPYYEYTLPYVIIALGQGEGYASDETMDFLLNTSIQIADKWQDTTWGTDAVSPMLIALSPYCEGSEQIHGLVTQATELIKAYQGENGSVGNAASTGLAMWGLCGAGENPAELIKNNKNLIDGLLAEVNESRDGFLPSDNSFATEQGFRGLVACKLLAENQKPYDFYSNPMNEAKATQKKKPSKRPSSGGGGGGALPSDKKDDKEDEKLPESSVESTESINGLEGKHEDVKIPQKKYDKKSFNDIANHQNQEAIETLAGYGIINGRTKSEFFPDDTMTRAEFATIVVRSLGLSKAISSNFSDVSDSDWFSSYVNTACSYGIVKGISDTQFNPYGKISRQEAATMISRAASLCGMKIEIDEEGIRNVLSQFTDYRTCADWAAESIAFCYSEQILAAEDMEINPGSQTLRAEIANMLFNMLKKVELI